MEIRPKYNKLRWSGTTTGRLHWESPLSIHHRCISITWIIRLLPGSDAHINHSLARNIFCEKKTLRCRTGGSTCVIIYIPIRSMRSPSILMHSSSPKLTMPSRILKDINLRISVWKSLLRKMHPFYQWHEIIVSFVAVAVWSLSHSPSLSPNNNINATGYMIHGMFTFVLTKISWNYWWRGWRVRARVHARRTVQS